MNNVILVQRGAGETLSCQSCNSLIPGGYGTRLLASSVIARVVRPHEQYGITIVAVSASCFTCHRLFSFFKRRHHCRNCGNVFCSPCANKRVEIPRRRRSEASVMDAVEQSLVCDSCCSLIVAITGADVV